MIERQRDGQLLAERELERPLRDEDCRLVTADLPVDRPTAHRIVVDGRGDGKPGRILLVRRGG